MKPITPPFRSFALRCAGFLAAGLLLAACGATPGVRLPEEGVQVAAAAALPSPTAVLPGSLPAEISPTPRPRNEGAPPTPSPQPQGPTPAPLQFTFPDPGPEPVSAWRPPLYPVPWAPTPLDHFYFTRPIPADQINWPLANYRYGGVFFENVVHSGVDIPAESGAPVIAAGPGRIAWAGYGLYYQKEDPDDPYGLAIAIKHDFGHEGNTLYTVYGHMQKIFVTLGQHVEAGDLLGLVGETGITTGPHLHFEVRIGKNNFFGTRNPELWISPPQGWGVLAGRLTSTAGQELTGQEVKIRFVATGQEWSVISYGGGSTNSDPYYNENLVIGDLPAGEYELSTDYNGINYKERLSIQPGLVSFFTFTGKFGFTIGAPAAPGTDFTPVEPP